MTPPVQTSIAMRAMDSEEFSQKRTPTPKNLIDFFHYAHLIKVIITQNKSHRPAKLHASDVIDGQLLSPPTSSADIKFDHIKYVQMALVHDLVESILSDLTPDDSIRKEAKRHGHCVFLQS